MQIRNEQMEAMYQAKVEEFVKRMVKHLHNDLPEHCKRQGLHEKDLESLVRRGMNIVMQYGISSEDGTQQYLDCMVVLSPDFDQDQTKYPWASEILRDEELTPSQKSEALSWNLLFAVDWEEANNG